MRINRVRIQNFRCLADVELAIDDVTTLVGSNGAGKSSILRALDWFFNPTTARALTDDDVFSDARPGERVISVEVEFDSLTEADREALGTKYAPPSVDKLVIWQRRFEDGQVKFTGKALAFPQFENVRSGVNATERRQRYNELRQQEPELELPAASSEAAVNEAMLAWEREHRDQLVEAEVVGTNFFGFVGQGAMSGLFDYVLVTADLRAAEEIQDSKNAVIGRILEKAVNRDAAETAIAELVQRMTTERNEINDFHFKEQLSEISKDLTEAVKSFTNDREVRVATEEMDMKPQRPQFRVGIMDHTTETRIDRQGHGFQRALLISALRLLAQRGAAGEGGGVICLAIEEPELFQHPLQAKAFASVLRKLAEDRTQGFQIIYATHSPYFIEPRHFDQIRRVSRPDAPNDQVMPEVKVHSANEPDVIKMLDGYIEPEKVMNQLDGVALGRLQDTFFARAVILVEGGTDQAVLEGVSEKTSPLYVNGISVAEVGGKNNIFLPWAILTALKIPCYVVADGDKNFATRSNGDEASKRKNETNHKQTNRNLLRLLGEPEVDWPATFAGERIAFFEDALDTVLALEWPEWKTMHDALIIESLGDSRKHSSIYKEAVAKATGTPSSTITNILEQVLKITR